MLKDHSSELPSSSKAHNAEEQTTMKKRKKLPAVGYKINERMDRTREIAEIHEMLLVQKELLLEKRTEIDKLLITAEWDQKLNEGKVLKNSGTSLMTFGHSKNRSIYLYPEELLYLIEMNKLQLLYNDVRMSIQRSYSLLINQVTNTTLHQYRIFKHFVVHGYKLFRHEKRCIKEPSSASASSDNKLNKDKLASPQNKETIKASGVYEEYSKKLQIFGPITESEDSLSGLIVDYDVYSPQTVVRKSCRPEPDYYLIILRSEENMNSLFRLISSYRCDNLLFVLVSGGSISVFNIRGVELPDLF